MLPWKWFYYVNLEIESGSPILSAFNTLYDQDIELEDKKQRVCYPDLDQSYYQ